MMAYGAIQEIQSLGESISTICQWEIWGHLGALVLSRGLGVQRARSDKSSMSYYRCHWILEGREIRLRKYENFKMLKALKKCFKRIVVPFTKAEGKVIAYLMCYYLFDP